MDRIIALRNDALEGEIYMNLLDDLLKTVVGATKFKENRCEKHLSEWFTVTDEAFLLLCLENYWQQWHYEWMVNRNGPPADEPAPEVINPRYTGKTRGTKRSWSREEEWSVSITWLYWSITTEGKGAKSSISGSFGK